MKIERIRVLDNDRVINELTAEEWAKKFSDMFKTIKNDGSIDENEVYRSVLAWNVNEERWESDFRAMIIYG
jgi:hypothetical protein